MQSEFYKRYLRSPEWERKKMERMQIDDFKCVLCQRPERTCKYGLQVHHIHYKTLGAENPYTDLVTVCGSCHKKLHNYYNRIKQPQEVKA